MAVFDQVTRQQVLLQRVKAQIVRDYLESSYSDLREILAGVLANAEVRDMSPSRRTEFLASLADRLERIIRGSWGPLRKDLEGVAKQMAQAEADILGVGSPDLRSVPSDAINAEVPAGGQPAATLPAIAGVMAGVESRRLVQAVRTNASQGLSNDAVRSAVIGSLASRSRGTTLGVSRRHLASFGDLATQHTASRSRELVWMQETGAKRYRWAAILDSRTCLQCAPLDGRVFEVGEGPLAPIHPRCRCFAVALTDLPVDRTRGKRPSATGEVRADITYFEWLKQQPGSFQDSAIGPTRGKLLRKGGLTASEFQRLALDRKFEPMALEEMKRLRPQAFEEADI